MTKKNQLKFKIQTNQMSQYKILKVIGKGAFGDAYLGLHTTEKKQYVIKQVDIKNKSKQEKQHIFNQVKLLQQFNHVNIVSYRDSFIDRKGLLNIVMEYCEGGDMNQIIQSMQGNKITQDKIVYWLAQIALAIFYMHEKKILHRDLKSPNIFILKGNIRLGDFGISKVLDHVRDLAQTNIGTPYYMSPQQYNHKPYSYKSDIWAFGCILYEMCNQRRPFEANNIQALGMKVVRGNFPPVSQCYSKDLRNLIGDMLLKNPVKRPNIIEILLKPFIKKKVIEYMRQIYSKKEQFSKESLASLNEQAKKLSITLQEKKPILASKEGENQKQRSQSARKNRIEQEKQKEKLERERKKQELQNQLRKQNQQRKEMAEKLRKIQQERKALLAKKKNDKSVKSIYERAQSSHHESERSEYISEKYSSRVEPESKTRRTTTTQESSTNLIGKVLSQVPGQVQKSHSVSINERPSTVGGKKEPQKVTQQKKRPQQPLVIKEVSKPQQPEVKVQPSPLLIQQKKTFKMQQEYEMQFQDCQPEEDEENYVFSDQVEEGKSSQERQFEVKNRVPTFASDENKLAMEVKEIQNLVMVSNQAVSQIGKKQAVQSPVVQKDVQEKIQGSMVEKKKEQPKQTKKVTPQKQSQKQPQVKPLQQKLQQQVAKSPQQIQQKVQTLKQEIKMKTMHINSIRNQLSNIDFELSESEQQQQHLFVNNKSSSLNNQQPPPTNNPNNNPLHSQPHSHSQQQPTKQSFRKKQYNPQHAKINDRINMLIESGHTILGTQMYKKFYEYLITMKEKGRSVKREYLEQVLGKEKIGAYHLVQQIVRLKRVLDKIPKYL